MSRVSSRSETILGRNMLTRRDFLKLSGTGLCGAALLGSTSCGANTAGGSGAITVANVANPQQADMQKLTKRVFEKQNPGIKVEFQTLPENQLRDQVTKDIANQGGQYDLVSIGPYEVPLWARNGWLENLDPYIKKTPGYKVEDLIPSIVSGLSYKSHLYAVPFYGESSFLMYRKDIFDKAGLEMPEHPTWDQVAQFARKLHDPGNDIAGICLRGLPGWGEGLGAITTVVHAFGGRWFDMDWTPTFTESTSREAVNFYVDLVRAAGEPGAANSGFTELLTTYGQGNAAMWFDATVAASTLEDPGSSKVAGKNGYVFAPTKATDFGGWLWTWTLAMTATSQKKDAAWKFLSWSTSKEYVRLVGEKLGWTRVPPGTRTSTYEIPQYQKAASAFADATLASIKKADLKHPTNRPVPYTGISYVDIPEWQSLGTEVSQELAAAIAGRQSADTALQKAQKAAERTVREAGYKK